MRGRRFIGSVAVACVSAFVIGASQAVPSHSQVPFPSVFPSTGGPGSAQVGKQGITVVGDGTASQAPDVAYVSGQVQAQAPTANEAVGQASDALQAVITAARRAGATDADIQTSGISLYPLFTPSVPPPPPCIPPAQPVPVVTPPPLPTCGPTPAPIATPSPPRIYAYQASEGVTVRTGNLAGLGDLIGALIDGGLTNFSGPSYGVANPADLRARSLQAALADAAAQARVVAATEGVQLGELLNVTVQFTSAPPLPAPPAVPAFAGAGVPLATAIPRPAPTVPVQPGPLTATTRVSVTYAIGGPGP